MPFPPTPSNTPSNTATPSNTPSNTPSVTPSNTSCPITPTLTPTLTQTPTITPTSTTPPTVYLNLCLPEFVPENGIIELSFYSQVSPDCNSERINVDQTVGLNYDLYLCFPPYASEDCFNICPAYVALTAGTSCNSSVFCDGTGFEGLLVSGITIGNIFPVPTGSINYQIGTICYSGCTPCTTPTPTPTLTPTTTPTLTPTTTPTLTPTITSTSTPTPTVTQTPTATTPCDAADYLLFNETGSPLSWTALDCNGNGVGDTIPGGQQANTGCIQVGTLVEGSLTIVSSTPC